MLGVGLYPGLAVGQRPAKNLLRQGNVQTYWLSRMW